MKEKEKMSKAETRLGVAGLKKRNQKKIDEAVQGKKGKTSTETAEALCKDRDCPFHGKLKIRGRSFEGKVIKKFPKRITIEFERMIYIRKYERYAKSKTKIHARLPVCIEDRINIGDIVLVRECRPLSKIIHFVVIKKIKGSKEETLSSIKEHQNETGV